MNTYLVLLTPMLHEPFQSEWKASLLQLCHVMINHFYSPGERLFFLSGNRPEDKALATAGTDFGHNAKALWMIRWTGLITGSAHLVAFAEDNARVLLPRAYLDDCSCWADGILRGGALDVDKSWWIFAELDQLAGTLARVTPHSCNTSQEPMTTGSGTSSIRCTEKYGTAWMARPTRRYASCRSNGNGRTHIIPLSMRWSATLWRSSFTASL